jgi:hypothetical protein
MRNAGRGWEPEVFDVPVLLQPDGGGDGSSDTSGTASAVLEVLLAALFTWSAGMLYATFRVVCWGICAPATWSCPGRSGAELSMVLLHVWRAQFISGAEY